MDIKTNNSAPPIITRLETNTSAPPITTRLKTNNSVASDPVAADSSRCQPGRPPVPPVLPPPRHPPLPGPVPGAPPLGGRGREWRGGLPHPAAAGSEGGRRGGRTQGAGPVGRISVVAL